jgi:hypothetical protein
MSPKVASAHSESFFFFFGFIDAPNNTKSKKLVGEGGETHEKCEIAHRGMK